MSDNTSACPRLPINACRCERGAAAIEFAMVMPVFVVLLISIFAIGWALHGISSVNYALERTARHLQLNDQLGSDQLKAELDTILSGLGRQNASLDLELSTDGFGTRTAYVTATYQFALRIPLMTEYTIKHEKTAVVVLGMSQ